MGIAGNWKKLLGEMGVLFAVALAANMASAQGAMAFRNVEIGEKVPGFKLATTDGTPVEYAYPTEQAIILAFVRQGQEKSEKVMADLNKLVDEVASKSLVLAVVVNPDEGDAAGWASGLGITFRDGYYVLIDAEGSAYSDYGVMVAPQTGVVAPDGTLKADLGGHTSVFRGDVENALRDVLGIDRPPEVAGIAAGEDVSPERKLAMREMAKANMLIKRKMKAKAIPQARKAVESDDTYVEAHLLLADLLLDERQTEEAKTHYNRALDLAENNADAKVGLARVQAKEGDYEGAVAQLEKAALISPKSEMLYYYLGIMHEDAGQYEKAVASYRKALEKLLKGH